MPGPSDLLRRQITEAYVAATPGSGAMYERARRVLPAGVSGNLRSHLPYPVYTEHGDGAAIYDVDGRVLIDCFLCNGPPLLGHAHPAVLEAVRAAVGAGSLVLNPALLVEAAERLCAVAPCAERVRFLSSGTEACMAVARLARAVTGRSTIVKFGGDYHGQDDQFLIGVGESGGILSPGIEPGAVSATALLAFGDEEAARDLFAQRDDIAALLVDPVAQAGPGPTLLDPSYFATLQALCREHGALLIFDEVITGFRLGLGGAQERFGITPDLAVYAKALGNGERIAAVAGRAELMDRFAPAGYALGDGAASVFQSGSYNDGAAGLAAAIASIGLYEEYARSGGYDRLGRIGVALERGIRSAFAAHDVGVSLTSAGPLMRFSVQPDGEGADACSAGELTEIFSLALVAEGVLVPPAAHGHLFLSFAHDESDVRAVCDAFDRVLDAHDWRLVAARARSGSIA